MFAGSIVALVTPFSGDRLDDNALSELATWQVEQGTAAVAVNTAVGEAPTLTADERSRVISVARESLNGRAPVIAGICTSCTARGAGEARRAKAAGAEVLLVGTPPYNRPTQEGIVRHLQAIAEATDLPVLIHNDPGRARVDLGAENGARLLAYSNVVGFVDGAGDLACATAQTSTQRRLGMYTAHEASAAPFLMAGGAGILSAVANVAPRLCAELHGAVRDGVFSRATAIQRRLHPLIRVLGPEPDTAAIKYALFLLRPHFGPTPRLPLVPAPCAAARAIAAALAGLRDDVRFA